MIGFDELRTVPFDLELSDLRLLPRPSDVIPELADLSTSVERLHLPVPVIAAAMSHTVVPELAVAVAACGGATLLPSHSSERQIAFLRRVAQIEADLFAEELGGRAVASCIPQYRTGEQSLADAALNMGLSTFHIESVHGSSGQVASAVRELRSLVGSNTCIIAGNVVTAESAEALWDVGANLVKVGLGTGTGCTTTAQTGFGRPLASAIIEIAGAREASSSLGIIADGGIRSPGDIAKALALGADGVAIGAMLAGCTEAGGRLVELDGEAYKTYAANPYPSLDVVVNERSVATEGLHGLVKYSGSVAQLYAEIRVALKASLAFAGAKTLTEFRKAARFSMSRVRATESPKLAAPALLGRPIRPTEVKDQSDPLPGQLTLLPLRDSDDVGVVVALWRDSTKREVLVGRRRDGTEAFPGGRWARGERLSAAVRREAYEETGAVLRELRLASVHELKNPDSGEWRVSIGFEAIVDDETAIRQGDGGLTNLRWVSVDSILFGRRKLYGNDRDFLRKVIDNVPLNFEYRRR